MPLGNLPANADYLALLPAGIVALVPLLILFVDLFFRANGPARRAVAVGIALAGLVAAGVTAGLQYPHDYAAFGGAFVQGGFSIVFSDFPSITMACSGTPSASRNCRIARASVWVGGARPVSTR